MIKPEAWKPTDGIILEPNAHTAVVADKENVVVAAGPGSGKTELLAQRADFLLRTGLCPYPRRILAISFKVDAARNLRDRVRMRSGVKYVARFDSMTFHAFAKHIIDNFRPVLTGSHTLNADYTIHKSKSSPPNQITFNDMVLFSIEILQNNQYALGAIRQTYSHVLFDEFQDATKEQYELLQLAFRDTNARLTAVGDNKQRIMVFAGALPGIMEKFAEDFSAERLALYHNRRSEPTLRRMQNRMIMEMEPEAAVPETEIIGDDGDIEVMSFDSSSSEAAHIAELIEDQLTEGVPISEIAVLVREKPNLYAAELFDALAARGIPSRNEQVSEDLSAEPAAALVFNFIQVLAGTREPEAYAELMRVASSSAMEDGEASRFDRKLKRGLYKASAALREDPDVRKDIRFWRDETGEFLDLISRPALLSLSPDYSHAERLQEIIDHALDAFEEALVTTDDPLEAVRQLTGTNAIRVLTIHKCKGLEFQHVIILGVEKEAFRGSCVDSLAVFFVAISRAKSRLTLTHSEFRARPIEAMGRWVGRRTAHDKFLGYASD